MDRAASIAGRPWSLATLVNWGVILAGLVAAQGLTAIAVILVARRVSPAEYGQYLSCFAVATLLVVVPNFGMDSWLLARGAAGPAELGTLWWSALRARVGLLAVWALALVAVALAWRNDAFPPLLIGLVVLGVAGDSIAALTYAAWRDLSLHRLVTGFQVTAGLLLLCLTLALPIETGRIAYFAAGRAIVGVAAGGGTVWYSRKRLRRPEVALPVLALARQWRSFALADVATSVYLRADLTIVSVWLGAGAAGVYGPAVHLTNMSFLVPSALYFMVLPMLSRAHRQSHRDYARLGSLQVAAQMVTGIALGLGLYVLAPWIVDVVFGSAYADSAAVLKLLSPLLAFKAASFGLGAILTSTNHQAWRTTVQTVVAVFNVGANLSAIGILGLSGVALVYVASEGILCAGYAAFVCWLWKRRNG